MIITDQLTEAERFEVLRVEARGALCDLPPAAPDTEWTDDHCGTVWRTYRDELGRWIWLPIEDPEGCGHEQIERHDDATIDCAGPCRERLALRGEWGER